MHNPVFSLEVFPPKRSAPVGTIYDTLDGLEGLKPDFISVTYGHGLNSDSSATARIARTICQEYHIPAVAHLTALYADESTIDAALDMFDQAGVKAVLALRGDPIEGLEPTGVFPHASDLVAYLRRRRPDLTIIAACYPEGHLEANSLDEDIEHLKIKVDAGVDHLITQLFYDNDDYYRFLDAIDRHGITVPVEAGIMPVVSAQSTRTMSERTGARIPPTLERLLTRWQDDPQTLRTAGIAYACEQIADLVASGAYGIHLYTMNRPVTTRIIWHNVADLFAVSD